MSAQAQALSATLRTLTPQTAEIYTLRLDVPLSYKPGQSIQITFPGDAKKRYYSISSSPSEGRYIEITVKLEPGSSLEASVKGLKRGDPLPVSGPMESALALPEPLKGPVAFIAAGTGVTPFRSMIRSLIDQSVTTDYWLFHSVRRQADLIFQTDFVSWSGAHRTFHYVPTITRDFDNDWKNETGRINDTLIRKHLQKGPCLYLLCGPLSFVNDMETVLRQQLQVPAENIRREKW